MKRPQLPLYELILAIMFLGLLAGFAVWTGPLIVHGLVAGVIILFPSYLIVVLMIRRHWRGHEGSGRGR